MAVLEMRDVWKRYGRGVLEAFALRGVDLEIKAGGFVAVMGPSGSGKSTLLHILGALATQSDGQISFDGRVVEDWGDEPAASLFRLRQVGFIFQSFNLIHYLSAEENVALPLLLAGEDPEVARERGRTP